MTSYGYARFSTLDQDLTIQRAALKAASCTVVRPEKASGARRDWRTELQVLRSPATTHQHHTYRPALGGPATKDRPTKLARALEELGRLIKTLYLLRFIDDEAYRRHILVQLNRGEGRHQLARIVFHGKRGELRQRYREGQEDQLGALGLVVNVIVLWDTIYMDAALNQLRVEGFDVRDDDVTRLSPLGFDYINMLGRYAFILPDQIARGELRPRRDLQNTDDGG